MLSTMPSRSIKPGDLFETRFDLTLFSPDFNSVGSVEISSQTIVTAISSAFRVKDVMGPFATPDAQRQQYAVFVAGADCCGWVVSYDVTLDDMLALIDI